MRVVQTELVGLAMPTDRAVVSRTLSSAAVKRFDSPRPGAPASSARESLGVSRGLASGPP